MFSRGSSLVATPAVALLAVGGVAAVASVPVTIVAAFAGVLAVIHDIARLVMTEGATTRLQLLWTTRPPPPEALEGMDATSPRFGARTAPAALPEGTRITVTERTSSPLPADRPPTGR